MDLLDRMLGHDRWATLTILATSGGLTDEQLDREFDIGHRTLRGTLNHLVFIVDVWTAFMCGRLPERREPDPSPPVADLIARYERYHAAFAAAALASRDGQRLDETFVDYYGFDQSQGATILQVLYHNERHRAEALHMLGRLGVEDLWDYDPQEWENVGRFQGAQEPSREPETQESA